MTVMIERRSTCALARLCLAIAALSLWTPADCRGDLLQFDFNNNRPTIQPGDGTVTYDASTGMFNVQATDLIFNSLNLPNSSFAPITPTMTTSAVAVIDLNLDQNGNLLGPGSLTVTGAISFDFPNGSNDVSGTLLTGSVTAFGPAASGGISGPGQSPWEFDGLFTFTGGLLTQSTIPTSSGGTFSDLFKVGEIGGFDLVAEQQVSGIMGDFSQSFSGNTLKVVAAGVVTPEPNTAIILLVSLGMIAAWGRCRSLARRARIGSAG